MTQTITQHQLFTELFSAEKFKAYFDKLSEKAKVNEPSQLLGIAQTELDSFFEGLSNKCHNRRFRFSPYHEKLILKGKGKAPRMISVPSTRDKLVQRQITVFLNQTFPESAKTPRGNQFVKRIIDIASSPSEQPLWVYRGDIQKFYDEIPRDQLLEHIKQRIEVPSLIALIEHAMMTPTLPKRTKRKDYARFRSTKGVPQGLSFSGVLVNIFLHPVDLVIQQIEGVHYFRFVDDIFMIGNEASIKHARAVLETELEQRQLKLHTQGNDKEHLSPVVNRFSYLGYTISAGQISVRESSIERLRSRILVLFLEYRKIKLEISPSELTEVRRNFIEILNIKVTGARAQGKEYGWLFYYRYINDLTLLHQLDHFIRALLKKHQFTDTEIQQVKKFSRAFYEINFVEHSNYIFEYASTKIDFDQVEHEAKKPTDEAVSVTEPMPAAEQATTDTATLAAVNESGVSQRAQRLLEILRAKVLKNLSEKGYDSEVSADDFEVLEQSEHLEKQAKDVTP